MDATTLEIRREAKVDLSGTLELVERATGATDLRADHYKWLYSTAFGPKTRVVSAYHGDRKVGQAAVIFQAIHRDGAVKKAAQVIDLYVDPEVRGISTVSAIYRDINQIIRKAGAEVILAMPNDEAAKIDQVFLKVRPATLLDIRFGLSLGGNASGVDTLVVTREVDQALVEDFVGDLVVPVQGMIWDKTTLAQRISRPGQAYVLTRSADCLMVSAERRFKGVASTLVCAALPTSDHPDPISLRDHIAAATAQTKRRVFLYVGRNERVIRPGFRFPDKVRPSRMELNVAMTDPIGSPFLPERFEAIDFDFA